MILHLLLWALRLSEIHQAPLSPQVRSRAQAALDFMRSWVDVHSGLAPNYGSDDGTLLFPLASASYRDFRPLLQLGAAILDRPSLLAGPWDEAPLWFGIKPETPGFKPETIKPSAAISSALGQTGYFRLGDADSWALIRAGHYARRPFQADQLHVDLWCHGLNLARDPGTYLYNGPAPWNNGLSATAVHNTVTVDYQDQMRRAGRFLWLDWAQASGRMFASNHDAVPDRFAGEHDGYRRLGVTHRRMVQWLKGAGWLIVDDIEGDLEEDLEDDRKYDRKGRGEHDLCLHWLTPDLPFQIVESPFRLVLNSQQDRFAWNIFSSAPATPGIIRAGKTASPAFVENQEHKKTDLRGWEASTYGRLRPAISIVCQCRAQLPIRFVTALLTDSRVTLRQQDKDIVIFANPAATEEMYRVNLAPASPIRSQTAQAMHGHSVSVA